MASQTQPNPFLLAAEVQPSTALLPLLRSTPSLASSQDAHGYSLVHALTSYNHLDLLRSLIREFQVSPNLRDEDGETALFVAESVEAAQLLVEELGLDSSIENNDGQTAEEKIREEGDYVAVAEYLKETRTRSGRDEGDSGSAQHDESTNELPPPLPNGVKVNVGTMIEDDVPAEINEDFRRRIEELAGRDDFEGEAGQEELRQLIKDAVHDVGTENDGRESARRRVA